MSGTHYQLAASRLRERKQQVIETWVKRVRERLDSAKQYDRPAVIDSLPKVLDRMADALESSAPAAEVRLQGPLSVEHAQHRAALPSYSLEAVVDEYKVLHKVIIEILDDDHALDSGAHDLIADAILLAVREAAAEFARSRSSTMASELRATGVRFQHMVEAVKDYAIFTIDPSGVITSWNTGCMRMKLYTAEEAIGENFSMLYPEEGRRRDEPMGHLRSAAIEGRFRGEGVRRRKNGELFLADVCITPIFDGDELTGFTKVVQDMTERNLLMQERDLSRADTTQLRADAEYRQRFVATLTHDLRSPLATAKTGADLISLQPEDPQKVKTWAARIGDALKRADGMIGDLLDAAQLQAGQTLPMEFAPCDLEAIADALVAEHASRLGDRLRVDVEGSSRGNWSADGLRRALENLVSNAVKYGDAGQPITIRIRRVDDRVLLSVHNFGTIIPLDEQAKLFQPFHRARTAKASGKQGWGIGLALVKGIVEAHKGIVKTESYPKEGTTFTADLPVDAATAKPLGDPVVQE
jgi:PAS domain S-box-containing protein